MTKREAKRQVCGALANVLQGHRDQGAAYLTENECGELLPEADAERLDEAAVELLRELFRRSR